MDVSERYSASLASLLPSVTGSLPLTCSPGVNTGSINQDYRLARSVSGSLISSAKQRTDMEKSMPLGKGWNSVDHGDLGLTVDPSKGGFALQGVILPSSPSITRFTSNPGFAERAARYSAFGNGHFSQSLPANENGVMRSASQPYESDTKLAKMSSRGEIPTGAMCSPEVSDRSQANVLDGCVEGEDGRSRLYRSTSGACSPAQTDERCNVPDMDRAGQIGSPSESAATNGSRGQETSNAKGPSGVTQLSGKKRKSSVDEAVKDPTSPNIKEQKSTGAQSKRSKGGDDKDEPKTKAERSDNSSSSSQAAKDSKHVDHPKTDYIHVRARRGQATDSHSLAERVRREKISERMKFLQDLVPGCSKVTGKAVMLDEIINYVQSIQRQVEFLSMKLAAVTPRPEFNIDSFLTKQLQMGQNCGLPNMVEHPESSLPFLQLPQLHSQQPVHMQQALTSSLENQQSVESTIRRMNSAPVSLHRASVDIFGDSLSQLTGLWEGDLQSVVQMGFTQGRPAMGIGGFQCDLPPGHIKIEL